MDFAESETVELKRQVIPDLCREIIAFANSRDGTLYIGVEDDGTPCGVADPNQEISRITNMVKDQVRPDLMRLVHYKTLDAGGVPVIEVSVQKGPSRPYYLASKGPRPSGVYVRNGTSADPASEAAILAMIKESDGESFESLRSLEQNLTFGAASVELGKGGIALDNPAMRTLGMVTGEGLYTNLALLLSDQNPSTVKLAAFSGEEAENFIDRREFTGAIFTQIEDLAAYLEKANPLGADFEGLKRRDRRAYPQTAIRETLLNFFVHRDYSKNASSLVGIYSDRIEFLSIGGLYGGMTLEDALGGVSMCRNPKLAAVFYRLGLIEAFGTGIRKIRSAYKAVPEKPEIEALPSAFRVTLPSMNARLEAGKGLLSPEERVLQLLEGRKAITRRDVDALLDTSAATSSRLLRAMEGQGLLRKEGKGRGTCFVRGNGALASR